MVKTKIMTAIKKASPFFFLLFLFSCKKDSRQITKEEQQPQLVARSVATTQGGGQNCYNYSPLTPQSDGSYTGYIDNIPIKVSSIMYQAYDQNGYPITYQDGDPFLGVVTVMGYGGDIIYNNQSPQDDQIILREYLTGATTINLSQYQTDLSTYYANQVTWQKVGL